MRIVRYKQTEFLMPWKWRREKPLHRFILDIHYAVFLPIVPSREVLNELLLKGSVGGGMGTGFIWEPFALTLDEYADVLAAWRDFDLWKIIRKKDPCAPPLRFVYDEEIMSLANRSDYLKQSRQKYGRRSWEKA